MRKPADDLARAPEKPYGVIRVNAGGGSAFWAKVDLEDWEHLAQLSWQLAEDRTTRYAATRWQDSSSRFRRNLAGSGRTNRSQQLGRVILGEPPFPGARVRHINGDGLDCRRANLKWATQSEILANRKPAFNGECEFKGVAWDESHQKWVARFRGRTLGRTLDEEEAARWFDDAAFAHWGHDCYLNFPERYPRRKD
jgi:hypothetical protein